LRVAIIGFGNVGQAFARILLEKSSEIFRLYGFKPIVVAVADKGGAALSSSGLDMDAILKAKKLKKSVSSVPDVGRSDISGTDVLEEVETDVVVEATPTNITHGEPGLTHIKTALKMKKHVITTNKGPLAIALPALMELASYNNVTLRFSGTVGGGTPILDLGKRCLLGDRIISIRGILNGTSNYILTRMSGGEVTMEEALREAQAAGYAEADPTYDVEGIDTACKLVIIANWLMDRGVTIKDVEIIGITGVTLKDIAEAKAKGCNIKLIGAVEDSVWVKPQLIKRDHPLSVSGTLNAVTFRTEYAGDVTIVGKGAGGVETAGAVLRDLIEIRRSILAPQGGYKL
jgi:homoserine dehydrogenase